MSIYFQCIPFRVFTHVVPHNASPVISTNISHNFEYQISHMSHTSNFPDISDFSYKYFLSHPPITFLLSFHNLKDFIPHRFTNSTSLPLLHCPAFFPLSSSCRSTECLCNVPSVVGVGIIATIYSVLPFCQIRFTSPNYRQFSHSLSLSLSHTSIHFSISIAIVHIFQTSHFSYFPIPILDFPNCPLQFHTFNFPAIFPLTSNVI